MSLNKNFKKKMVSYALAMSLITLSSISYGMQEESPWSVKENALVMEKNFIETNEVTRNNGIHYQVVSMKGVREILDLISEHKDLMFFTDIDDVIIHEPTKAKVRGCEFPEGKKPFNCYFPLEETVVELIQSLQEKYQSYAITAASGRKTASGDSAQIRIEALQEAQINFHRQKMNLMFN